MKQAHLVLVALVATIIKLIIVKSCFVLDRYDYGEEEELMPWRKFV